MEEYLKTMEIDVIYEDDNYHYGFLSKGVGLYRNISCRIVRVIANGEDFCVASDDEPDGLVISDVDKLIDEIGDKIAKFHVYYLSE